MWHYYCDEDRARLAGGIGYVGHNGGGQLKDMPYHEFVSTIIYPLAFIACFVTTLLMVLMYYLMFGTFASGRRNRYS
eukprot:NODE_4021_length_502_cov_116.262693_g3431_i0.p1 GENE.NODE_4021_length_502_cov_116.262693_g3431_i0~~NODE_4021_length_502_cov_116.262693_g3431_i0.p1  ORF type:complete len:77 (-),score=14.86 NODE_4021_length_502_cov_116.262693_g3431_i0:228-458(-)